MTARNSSTSRRTAHRAAAFAALAILAALPAAQGAVSCGDRFAITIVPTMWDGFMCDVVMMKNQTITLATGSFTQWRPLEEPGPAALTLVHQTLPDTRIEICAVTAPALPNTEANWRTYVDETAAALGEDTVISELTGVSTSAAESVHVLEWETREVRFTFTRRRDGRTGTEFHLIATEATRGVRFVVTAPAEHMERAVEDLRIFLNAMYRPETRPS